MNKTTEGGETTTNALLLFIRKPKALSVVIVFHASLYPVV